MLFPKNILITGGSSGIGEALARYYAASGVFLLLTGRNESRLQAVEQQCRAKGAVVHGVVADVTDMAAMKTLVEEIDRDHPLDLVIANAGISGGTGGGGESEVQLREIFDVNLNGVINTITPVLPLMAARQKGQVVLMSSLAAFSGWPGAPAYSASKGVVRLYGEALRGSMAGTGVQINVVCPGFVRTPLTAVNDYPMPFLMEADKAAEIIARGLVKNRGRIAFPWPSYLLAGFLGLLPYWLSVRMLGKLPKKVHNETRT